MSKLISHKDLTPNLSLSECNDGFWLYDKTQGMNLSMRAKTPEDAFVEALTYYQTRFKNIKADYTLLKQRVDDFVSLFCEEED